MAKRPRRSREAPYRSPFPSKIVGGGVELTLTPDEIYFETGEALPENELGQFLRTHNLEHVPDTEGLFPAGAFNRAFKDRRWVRIVAKTPPE